MMVKMILTEAENGMFATRTGSECLISSARIPKDENIKKNILFTSYSVSV